MPIPKYDDIPAVIIRPELKRTKYDGWDIGVSVIIDGENIGGDSFYRNTLPEVDMAISEYIDSFKEKLKKVIHDQRE